MVYIVHFKFSKVGKSKYISHLDLMRLFARAGRRADLPLYLTKGFSPHPKIIIKRALKLGVESRDEECRIYLNRRLKDADFMKRLNLSLPEGVRVLEVFSIIAKPG